jgi:hypothetical protein
MSRKKSRLGVAGSTGEKRLKFILALILFIQQQWTIGEEVAVIRIILGCDVP